MTSDLDHLVRLRAFEFLSQQCQQHGDVLPRPVLEQGFVLQGTRVPLLGPQGIFKPKLCALPLSLTTAPVKPGRHRPYDDSFGPEGLRYRYRGKDPLHHENVGLRKAMERKVPLIYFHGIVPGRYFAAWPVFIVGDEPSRLTFYVAVDDAQFISPDLRAVAESGAEARRAYITTVTRSRLHQKTFRERVLRAYRECCALCRLRHGTLLDAAHIIPDSMPAGEPIVSNGLALCKLHHAAFDQHFLGVRPDYTIHVRQDILDEIDGPMLEHGLQRLHNGRILLPGSRRDRPDPALLTQRYEHFLRRA